MSRGWHSITLSAALSWFMKLVLVGLFPYEIYIGDYLFAFATFVAIVLSLVPSIVERNYNIHLPFELDLLITLAIFLHTFLGEVMRFYEKVWLWDKVLHFYGSAVIAMLAFMIVYTLHYTRKLRLTIPFIGFFTVIFAMAVGTAWELGEFAVDNLFDKTTQRDLPDTMWDLVYDLVGGTLVAGMGMLYVRYSRPEERKRFTKPLGEVFRKKGRMRGSRV
ncbi:MAG: hypothetical protein V3W31_09225 [Thermodesulfobacteriota bacterium]